MKPLRTIIPLLLLASAIAASASTLGTAFTYQGRLNAGGNVADGTYDMRFAVYDGPIRGTLIAGPITNAATVVSNGLFTVNLDFGAGVFTGDELWLQIGVRSSSELPFTGLAPRQNLSGVPYAHYAPSAGLAAEMPSGAVTSAMLADGSVTTAKIGQGAVKPGNIDDGGKAAYEDFLGTARALSGSTPVPFESLALVFPKADPQFSFLLDGAAFGTVEGFAAREAISEPYQYVVEVTASSAGLDPNAQVGRRGALLFTRNGVTTTFAGVVTGCSRGSREGVAALYMFRLEPFLAWMNFTTDYHIFQNQKMPEVVSTLYRDVTADVADSSGLSGSYTPRELVIQYAETSLNFFSRLLEEEGISYFYGQRPGDLPLLKLGDSPAAFLAAPYEALVYTGDSSTNRQPTDERVLSFQGGARESVQKTTLRAYNPVVPSVNLMASRASSVGRGEFYQFGFLVNSGTDLLPRARARQERQDVERNTRFGAGNAADLRPGYTFTLQDQSGSNLGGSYLVMAVRHGGYRRTTNSVSRFYYGNEFEVIPAAIPFRPALKTPRPVAQPSTAVVTGPTGEEIWTDSYGRVKVQFHWDRYGARDETSSAWIRVASQLAGKQWGMIFLPRIGQEVMVEFLNGDPDEPVITGSLYNWDQMPPYSLPAGQTRSGVKTRSSKAGTFSNFNELRFEDKKGSEEIYVHAEKDFNMQVNNNLSLAVEQDVTAATGNNLTSRIGHDLAVSVNNNVSLTTTSSVTVSAGLGMAINTTNDPTIALNVGGTVAATAFQGSGAGLTSLSAAALAGTVPDAQLSPNVALLNRDQVFTGVNSFSSDLQLRPEDRQNGLGWYGGLKPFAEVAVNGPVLYGTGGGALGTAFLRRENLALFWNSAGRVGIGTTTPANLLHVHSTSATNLLRLAAGGVNGAGATLNFGDTDSVYLSEVNAGVLRIEAARVGVGRAPAANRFEVEGEASKAAAGSWLANSDARIKTDITTITNALETLARVRPVSFRYRDEYRAQHPAVKDHPYVNVVAQEFREVFPDAVKSSGEKLADGSEILQVDTYPLTIYAAAAIRELNQRYTTELQRRDAEITDLKQRLESLERLVREGARNGEAVRRPESY